MQNFSLQSVAWLLTLMGWAIAGLFVIVGFFGQGSKSRKDEADKLADGLITRLQQTVEQQAKDLAQMRAEQDAHTKQRDEEIRKLSDDLKHLQGRNGVLEDLFKGRDPAMVEFFKKAPELVDGVKNARAVAIETHDAVLELTSSINELVKAITPLMAKPETAPA